MHFSILTFTLLLLLWSKIIAKQSRTFPRLGLTLVKFSCSSRINWMNLSTAISLSLQDTLTSSTCQVSASCLPHTVLLATHDHEDQWWNRCLVRIWLISCGMTCQNATFHELRDLLGHEGLVFPSLWSNVLCVILDTLGLVRWQVLQLFAWSLCLLCWESGHENWECQWLLLLCFHAHWLLRWLALMTAVTPLVRTCLPLLSSCIVFCHWCRLALSWHCLSSWWWMSMILGSVDAPI